jgi:hypothetical protein
MGELIQRDSEPSRAITIQPQDTASRLIEVALTSGADIDKLERLLVMQQTWEAGQARKAFFQALSGFQSNLPPIKKTKEASFPTRTGQMTYSYASLDDIAEAIRFSLKEYGLSYRFEQKFEPGGYIWVKCIVSHKDGHSEECSMPAMADTSGQKNIIQQIASSITYLRRYTLTGALGIATTDQDLDGADVGSMAEQPAQQHGDHQPQPQVNQVHEPEYYPEDSFNKNFPTWKKAIESGRKTKASVIATVESKGLLTSEQITKINSIEEPQK